MADNVVVNNLTIDGARITGLGATITVATTEHLTFSGLGGDDTLQVVSPNSNDTVVVSHGANPDSGSVAVNSLLPVGFQGLGSGGTLALDDAGGQDKLIVNGNSGNDNFAVNVTGDGVISYQSDVSASVGGTSHVITTTTNAFESLLLNGYDGDDNFIINASAFFPTGLAINAGNPSSGSDRVTVNGTAAANAYTLILQAGGDSVTGVVGGPVVLNNVEDLSFSSGAGDDTLAVSGMGGQTGLKQINFFSGSDTGDAISVAGTINVDQFQVTPQSPTDATITANSSGTTLLARLGVAATSTLTLSGAAAADTVVVNGTNASETIAIVKGATTTVSVGANKTINVDSTTTENVTVEGGDGNDVINVSGTSANGQLLTINAGSPTSNAGAAADVLNVILATAGTAAAVPGAAPDAGVITNPDGNINYSGVDFFNVTGAAGANTFNIQGTHDNDTMALQFLGGANRVWVNNRAVYTFASFATVNMNGLFGDDKINVLPVGLVGVTTINVAGGDPTASDELVVSGTTGNDVINYTTSNTVGSGSVAITGSATVNFTTTEALVIDGVGGTDNLTVTTPAGVGHRTTVTPGANADSGKIVSQAFGAGTGSVPLTYAHIGAVASVTLVGQGDIVEFNGTANTDTFNISGTTIQVINATGGFVTNLFNLTNIFSLEARGLDGDDQFNVTGTLAAIAGGLVIDGGNPSASDSVNLSGAIAAVTANLGTKTHTISPSVSGYGAIVSLTGIEVANLNATGQSLTVVGSAEDETVTVTPSVGGGGTVNAGSHNPVIHYTGALANTLNVDLAGGINQLTVVATSLADVVTVLGDTSVDTGVFGGIVDYSAQVPDAISVLGLQGDDRFNVTPGASPIFIDGGDPIGVQPGDVLSVINAAAFYAGPENDEGGFATNAANVSFDHIESLLVAPIVGCPFLVVGTDANDQITVIARDASTHAGADGVQDFTVSLNAAPQIILLDVADLFIDAKAGNDDVVIVAAAPNEADWDVNVRVAGGTPSIGGPGQSDRLVVQTPNALGGFDNVVFNATGADTGNLVIDNDANGIYDAAGTDSLITFDSFVFNCPPANFTYTSSLGGVELVQLDGQGAPAIDDNLTINGTVADDTTVVSPAGAGSGYFVSDASPRFEFKSFDFLAVTPGANGFDSVTINGTAGNDVVTSTATDITLGGVVSLTQGIDALNINTLAGNDNVDLDLQLPSLRKTIDLGTGDDTTNLLGLAVDPADPTIYGGDGDDIIIGSPNPDLIFGGTGNDILIGAGGIDQVYGEAGNDTFGNPSTIANGIADDAGNDLFNGGEGSDTFVWEPGDGSDTIEGGAGDADVLQFFGGAGAEVFNVFAKLSDPTRAVLFRNTGNITMDMAGVDQINVTGNAGVNSYVIGRANNGDSGNVVAPTAPYTDPTASLSDLSTTEVKVVNIIDSAVSADTIYVDGRSGDDNLVVNVDGAASNTVRVTGLPYEVRVTGTTTADRLTIRGNAGNDTLRVLNTTGPTVDSLIGVTLAGSIGNDILIGSDILIGGFGDDYLEGGALADQLFGNEGEDTMVGGAGNDTFDGGDGTDAILVRGTSAADAIDINQTADVTLLETVNGVTETDTLVLLAGIRTVERVKVQAGDGDDTIRVQWADSLGTDANVNSLRVDVDGGAGTTADRLGVVDLGTGDLILIQNGTTNDNGSMSNGPGNEEPLVVTYTSIETAQPIVGNGGDVVVFKHDPFEFNNFRTNATYLGANSAINVDPVINPGVDPIFGFPGDEDWYRVVAESTGVLDFQVYFRQVATVASGRPGLPNAGNLDISVTDAAGNVVAGFGTNDNTNDERVRIPAIAGQTYYLRVFANGAAINTYDITVDNYAAPIPRDIELLDNPVGDPPPANSDTGRSQFDNVTRDNTPTLVFRLDDGILLNDLPGNAAAGNPPDEVIPIPFQAGAGVAGFRVAIFDEGSSPLPGTQVGTAPQTPLGFATQVAPGVYQFTTPALSDGSHFLTARVQMVDPANPQQTGFGDRSVALEVVVDTVTPPVFFGTAASATDGLHKDSDSGIATVLGSYVDRITNDTTPTMYGVAEANTIVKLYVDRTANGFTADDILLGQTVTPPLDGTNQGSGEWQITPTTGLNSPDLVATLGKDGLRTLFVTAEDLAGNVSAPQSLNILIDTTPPIVTAVNYPNGQSVFGTKPTASPTPRVDSIFITYQGGPPGAGGLEIPAVDPGLALDIRNYKLVGDNSGTILITGSALISSSATEVVIRIDFSKPLPDDRFSLTISDEISDAANNALDGNSQAASPGNAGAVLPSGNGIAGGNFVGRFTVDSRPELGAVSEGLIYTDINGNFVWDVVGKDDDQTNRDLTFQLGRTTDRVFAGNFARVGTIASGYDKLGAYGKAGALYSFALDTNDDGVADFVSSMPGAYQVNGIPVAGNFSNAKSGDEIGLFDGSFWYLDTNGNNTIDVGERIASDFNGEPVVGDFNGDGADDLATFTPSTNTFRFDTNRDGSADFVWNVSDQVGRFIGLTGFTMLPIAGDMNLDGIDDVGLWVKGRSAVLPRNMAETFMWLSDTVNVNPALVFNSYSPDPLGNDLYLQYGDEMALPVFGNFDPPTGNGSGGGSGTVDVNPLHRSPNGLDVNGDGIVSAADALIVINLLNKKIELPVNDPNAVLAIAGGHKVDTSADLRVSAVDALLVINELNRTRTGSAEGEASDRLSALDSVFAQMGDIETQSPTRKKR
ncbi:MAG: dockerin type I domain-containing protein [Pirellulales bacterium]